MNIVAYAKIQLTVEVETPGTYGGDWNLDKVQAQASQEGVNRLLAALPKGARIVGKPTVVDVVIRRNEA